MKEKRDNFKLKFSNKHLNESKDLNSEIQHLSNNLTDKNLADNQSHKTFFDCNTSINYSITNMTIPYDSQTVKSQKEIKMLRNRISAQKSRDKMKNFNDILKKNSQKLLYVNCELNRIIYEQKQEIESLKQSLGCICKDCSDKIIIEQNKMKGIYIIIYCN